MVCKTASLLWSHSLIFSYRLTLSILRSLSLSDEQELTSKSESSILFTRNLLTKLEELLSSPVFLTGVSLDSILLSLMFGDSYRFRLSPLLLVSRPVRSMGFSSESFCTYSFSYKLLPGAQSSSLSIITIVSSDTNLSLPAWTVKVK